MRKFSKLNIGSAGIPLSTPNKNTLNGIKHVKTLGLDSMELEFVRNINVSKELAPQVKKESEKNDIILSCHGQYYINLNSKEKEKKEASVKRILSAARRAYESGAFSMTFHGAYYMKENPEKVHKVVKDALISITKTLKDEGVEIWVRPETTGKVSQYGSLIELLKLSQEIGMVMPTIDFAHLHARENGKLNNYDEFCKILQTIEKFLGREGLDNMHIHFAGINYSKKGELNHLNLKDSDLNYKDMAAAWQEYKIKGVAICESPNIEKDALLVKKEYNSQKKMFEQDSITPEFDKSQKAKGKYSRYKIGGGKRTKP
ncbi:TIM barrel protein [Candidatus Woesearchaeota archaeon]|nr:TIM barrel protein [Candidatus Woesearchaeota archaeon]